MRRPVRCSRRGGSGSLHFPAKVATSPEGLLAVADSGHNRVVVARAGGDAGDGGAELLVVAETGGTEDEARLVR